MRSAGWLCWGFSGRCWLRNCEKCCGRCCCGREVCRKLENFFQFVLKIVIEGLVSVDFRVGALFTFVFRCGMKTKSTCFSPLTNKINLRNISANVSLELARINENDTATIFAYKLSCMLLVEALKYKSYY